MGAVQAPGELLQAVPGCVPLLLLLLEAGAAGILSPCPASALEQACCLGNLQQKLLRVTATVAGCLQCTALPPDTLRLLMLMPVVLY
jgi:hypothetical protein